MPLDSKQFKSYLDRIQVKQIKEGLTPLQILRILNYAHVMHIPFENLDIHLGRPIKVDQESIYEKLVSQQRGGYCYESNELLALALEHLGFAVSRMTARVLFPSVRSNSHKILIVELIDEGRKTHWLIDTGFSANSLRQPILLPEHNAGNISLVEQEIEQSPDCYKILLSQDTFKNSEFTLQAKMKDDWNNLYSFYLIPSFSIDFEMHNYSLSNKSDSPFVNNVILAKTTLEGRLILVNRKLTIRNSTIVTKELDDHEYVEVLLKEFNLNLEQYALDLLKAKSAQLHLGVTGRKQVASFEGKQQTEAESATIFLRRQENSGILSVYKKVTTKRHWVPATAAAGLFFIGYKILMKGEASNVIASLPKHRI